MPHKTSFEYAADGAAVNLISNRHTLETYKLLGVVITRHSIGFLLEYRITSVDGARVV